MAPFTAYLLAELIHASGVLAVLVSGLIMAQVAPSLIRAEHRRQTLAFWHRARTVSGFAGFRGAVSLAVAHSVPETLDSGEPFPDRAFIVFVTSGDCGERQPPLAHCVRRRRPALLAPSRSAATAMAFHARRPVLRPMTNPAVRVKSSSRYCICGWTSCRVLRLTAGKVPARVRTYSR
ncbi:hypothetical protein [Streptomyces sp. SA15]|uniref:hypothetical protein n=1 Tax=Streptomyces sp. SA15 TaxID=934019 RepID=UPI0015CDA6C6|nr:hypothetical protein [Streptomyces sp. SA15]